MIVIGYDSEGFPTGSPVTNGLGSLQTSWDDLLWAAVTVGRPNRQYVFKHGLASQYEALFRWSLIRMALEQNGPAAYTLRRTEAAKTLDPSEKGAVNYFLGLTIGKLFADRVLNVPWMMHLDVFRPMLNPLLKGRSRPDLVGQGSSGQWVAFECKGRATEPNATAKDKAKEQAERLVRINGAAPALNAACFTYYRNDVVEFFWRDPPPEREPKKPPIEVRVEPDDWRYYYLPVLDILRSQSDAFHPGSERGSVRIPALDLEVAVEPRVLVSIGEERWDDARRLSESVGDDFHRDGIKVSAGPSWLRPFAE